MNKIHCHVFPLLQKIYRPICNQSLERLNEAVLKKQVQASIGYDLSIA